MIKCTTILRSHGKHHLLPLNPNATRSSNNPSIIWNNNSWSSTPLHLQSQPTNLLFISPKPPFVSSNTTLPFSIFLPVLLCYPSKPPLLFLLLFFGLYSVCKTHFWLALTKMVNELDLTVEVNVQVARQYPPRCRPELYWVVRTGELVVFWDVRGYVGLIQRSVWSGHATNVCQNGWTRSNDKQVFFCP